MGPIFSYIFLNDNIYGGVAVKKVFLISMLVLGSVAVRAEGPPMRMVMRMLKQEANNLQQGILQEDFFQIAQSAEQIASYPISEEDREKIERTFGREELAQFDEYDEKVRVAAQNIVYESNNGQNMENILLNQQVIIYTCVKCHSQFRKRLRPVLYRF